MAHTRGPGSGRLMTGMDPLQRLGYAFMTQFPALSRTALATGVAAARLLLAPLAAVAAAAAGASPAGSVVSAGAAGVAALWRDVLWAPRLAHGWWQVSEASILLRRLNNPFRK